MIVTKFELLLASIALLFKSTHGFATFTARKSVGNLVAKSTRLNAKFGSLGAEILGVGSAVPDTIITNVDMVRDLCIGDVLSSLLWNIFDYVFTFSFNIFLQCFLEFCRNLWLKQVTSGSGRVLGLSKDECFCTQRMVSMKVCMSAFSKLIKLVTD